MCQIPPAADPVPVHREYLPESWAGFGFDRDGLLITRSGYKCSPQSLEAALWLVGCMRFDATKLLIRSDEAPGAFRPLYETSDADETGETKPTRLRLVEDQKRVSGGAREVLGKNQADRRGAASGHLEASDQDQEHGRKERGRQTSAAQEPPLQRLRRAAADTITVTPSALESPLAGEHAPQRALGGFPLLEA